MEIHFKIIGILLLLLALIHIPFPRYFKWQEELKGLSLINRQMMLTHTFFIALMVFFMGLLCMCCAKDLINTNLGHKLSLGLGIFWLCRMYFQFFVYSGKLWRGKTFETTVHIVFSLFWIYMCAVFFYTAFSHF